MAKKEIVDYIVVGSGAGGGTVAARLALAGFKVLVLEAGKDKSKDLNSVIPTFHPIASEDESMKWDFFVKHYTDSKRQKQDSKFDKNNDGILYPRCGSLGGCTVHNAMIMVYPHNRDWDRLAEYVDDPSWSADNMRKYYQRVENCGYGIGNAVRKILYYLLRVLFIKFNPGKRGYGGWLKISTANPKLLLKDKSLLRLVYEAVESSVEEQIGNPLERLERGFDPNDWRVIKDSAEGVAFTPMATKNGRRVSTREFLKQVREKHPDKLEIRLDCLASRVLFDENNAAIGVEYLQGEHLYKADPMALEQEVQSETKQVYAAREVIIAGGAFNTPQLLKLSGIGPKAELEKFGIEVKADLPGVGENLQDRYEVGVVSKMKGDFALLKGATFTPSQDDPHYVEWQKSGTGLYTSNGAIIGVIKRADKSRPDPDLYIFGLAGFFRGYFPGYSTAHIHERNYFTWAVLKGHTRNTAGRVTLKSADPRDVPDINFRYFDDDPNVKQEDWQEDLDSVVEGVEFVRKMNQDSDLQEIIDSEVVPGPQFSTREQVREFIKKEAWGHHASCTCKIGPKEDKMAVLDAKFRVRGTKNLRVVDASVFPHIPGLFIVSSVYMIGEKAAEDIIRDAKN